MGVSFYYPLDVQVSRLRGPWWIEAAAESIKPGMSGSPLVGAVGAAIGVVCSGQMQACLSAALPGWLLAAAGVT